MKKSDVPTWTKAISIITLALLLLSLAFFITVVYMSFFYGQPPASASQPFLVDKTHYHPGDTMKITAIDFCRYVDAPGTGYIYYVVPDSESVIFVAEQPASGVSYGCHESVSLTEVVPLVPDGEYIRRSRIVYDIGLGIKREAVFETEPFEVLSIHER